MLRFTIRNVSMLIVVVAVASSGALAAQKQAKKKKSKPKPAAAAKKEPEAAAAPKAESLTPEEIARRRESAEKAWELSRRVAALKDVTVGFQNYHEVMNSFPPAFNQFTKDRFKDGRPLLSWRVHVLQTMHPDIYDQFHLDEPWDSPHNITLLDPMPQSYRTTKEPTKTTIMAFYGEGAFFDRDQKGPAIADMKDGGDKTILVVEAREDQAVIWTKPDDLPFNAGDPKEALAMLPDDYFLAAMVDGRVLKISSGVPPEILKALVTRAGAEKVDILPYVQPAQR